MNKILVLWPLINNERNKMKLDTLEWTCSYLKMSKRIEISTHFSGLLNEIVLIIWMYLTHVEAMRSFGSLKCQRYLRLLEDYCYKSIDFYTVTFSTFQLCCTVMLDQYRLNVQIFKIGHRDCYSQLRIFSQHCLCKWIRLKSKKKKEYNLFSFVITCWGISTIKNSCITQCSWFWCSWSSTLYVVYWIYW